MTLTEVSDDDLLKMRHLAKEFKPEPIVDRPFAPPLECIMDLPFPVSMNRIWRQGKRTSSGNRPVYRSLEYKRWIAHADMATIANGTWRKRVAMPGKFTALILIDREAGKGDADNRAKVCLDWAQRVELIRDDKLAEEVTVRWVGKDEAPHGCRLILRSVA